jgi:type I restriction enzyme S subunit
MKHWELKKLGEVCKFEGGSQPPKSNFSYEKKDGYIRLIQIRDYKSDNNIVYIPKNKAKRFCNENDIMIGRYGPPVFQILKGLKGAYNVALMKAVPNENFLSKDFVYLFLKFSKIQDYIIHLSQRAAGQTGVNKEAIEDYQILLPPLSEQKRIVAILHESLAAIDQAILNTDKNLNNAKDIFVSYLQNIFLTQSSDWEQKKLGDISQVCGGHSFKSEHFQKSGKYQVIRIGNVRPGIIRNEENPVFIDDIDDDTLKKTLLKINDVIITQTGTKNKRDYGYTVIVNKNNYLLNQRIARIRFSNNYLPKFFLYFSWTREFKDQYFSSETGTVGQGNVGISAVTEALIPFCSLKEQNRIVSDIDNVFAYTKKLESIYLQKRNDLKELRESILQKAFSGELNFSTEKITA